ncbi:MAG: amidase, partial [Clostridia bacterium]|nr:amidase [Deltaproteobacteria bacterium]
MNLHEYVRRDAVGLAELVRKGEVSPRELVDTGFRAIAAVNPKLNAVIDQVVAHARSQVLELDAEAPFAGVPFLIKDSLERTGLKATWGVPLAADNVSQRTHEIARRIDAAGLITIGRTNMSELGLLPCTEAALYGATHNPWDLTRSPGGSSGGSASAVAAGIVPMAHGEDGGGSIRIPASACGLWGLKVGRGRFPQETWDTPDGFISHGVVSRSVRDSAGFVDAIHGARRFDRWQAPPVKGTFTQAAEKDPKKLHIGVAMRGLMASDLHPDCRAAMEHATKLLEDLGHHVEQADMELDGDMFAEHFTVIWAMSTGYFVRAAM